VIKWSVDYKKLSLEKHLKYHGKIEVKSKFGKLKTRDDLSIAYTPGVAAVSTFLAENPGEAKNYSMGKMLNSVSLILIILLLFLVHVFAKLEYGLSSNRLTAI